MKEHDTWQPRLWSCDCNFNAPRDKRLERYSYSCVKRRVSRLAGLSTSGMALWAGVDAEQSLPGLPLRKRNVVDDAMHLTAVKACPADALA